MKGAPRTPRKTFHSQCRASHAIATTGTLAGCRRLPQEGGHPVKKVPFRTARAHSQPDSPRREQADPKARPTEFSRGGWGGQLSKCLPQPAFRLWLGRAAILAASRKAGWKPALPGFEGADTACSGSPGASVESMKISSSSPVAVGDARLFQGLFHFVHRLAAPNELTVHDERRHAEDPGAGPIGPVLIDDGLERPGLDRLIHLRDIEPHVLGSAMRSRTSGSPMSTCRPCIASRRVLIRAISMPCSRAYSVHICRRRVLNRIGDRVLASSSPRVFPTARL